jgi:hypothetical protein
VPKHVSSKHWNRASALWNFHYLQQSQVLCTFSWYHVAIGTQGLLSGQAGWTWSFSSMLCVALSQVLKLYVCM